MLVGWMALYSRRAETTQTFSTKYSESFKMLCKRRSEVAIQSGHQT